MRYLISLFLSIFLLSVAFAGDFDGIGAIENKPDKVVQLTPKERAWLANHKRIRIAFDGSSPPYSFINDSGQLEGIAIEVMNTLNKRLGIKFETYSNTTWNKLYEAAVAHKVDVVATMVNRPDRTQWFNFTKPYLIKSLVIMTKRDNVTIKNRNDLVGKKVAMVKGYQYADRVIEEFPSVIPYFVDSMLDGLNAVSTDKADATITFMATASYLQTKYLLTDLKFAAFYDRNSANESIAVRKDWPTLAAILQKALDTLSEEEMQNIYAKWVPSIKPSTDYGLIWKIVAAFLIVLVILILWIARVRRQNRKIKLSKNEVQATNKILQALKSDLEHLVLKRTAELNSSEHKFRSLVENLRNEYFFYQRDCNGIFTYISPSITNILGYTVDEFMTHYHEYLTDNQVNLKIDELTKQYTQNMPISPYQLEIYNAQKNIHWLEVTDTPVYDEYDKCIGVVGIVHDITIRKQADDRLIWLSYYDELTGLANRRLFADRLQNAINMANRTKLPVSLFYLDLDRFKFINDSMGHAVGDEVLKETARRLVSTLRDSDIAARLGGDEFILLLPETDANGTVPVAEKILKKLREPYIFEEKELTLGASIGIAVYPQNACNGEALVHHADTAMYHAKQEKLGFSFYSESMQQEKTIG
ncbi:MAG: diguanylate cyclase [Methylococcaceae bacterium]|jgi:diguanylate cyclase (GGDEF)-like protein/PAS domain S-box-containing protein